MAAALLGCCHAQLVQLSQAPFPVCPTEGSTIKRVCESFSAQLRCVTCDTTTIATSLISNLACHEFVMVLVLLSMLAGLETSNEDAVFSTDPWVIVASSSQVVLHYLLHQRRDLPDLNRPCLHQVSCHSSGVGHELKAIWMKASHPVSIDTMLVNRVPLCGAGPRASLRSGPRLWHSLGPV